MSVQYHKEIFSDSNFTLKVNFFGLKDDVATASSLVMSIYAYTKAGQPVFSAKLNFEEIKSLYQHLNQISILKDGATATSSKFIESNENILELVTKFQNVDPNILSVILEKLKEEEKVKYLFAFLSKHEISALSTLQKLETWKAEMRNLKALLAFEKNGNIVEAVKKVDHLSDYQGGQPEKIFQNWIEKNYSWIFGIEYIKKYDGRSIALHSEGDMLMESVDGYLDLIELKRPSHEIFTYDKSHKSYYPTPDLSKVIGQSLYYLQKMDDLKLALEKEYKVKMIRPRIKIITGRTEKFSDEQYDALRMLNCQLVHIEIISYDALIKFGDKMIENYMST